MSAAPDKSAPQAMVMSIMPPRRGLCQTCATKHDPAAPHNAQSLYYRLTFAQQHGRTPNWIDATDHCSEAMRAAWITALANVGVDVMAGQVNPPVSSPTENRNA